MKRTIVFLLGLGFAVFAVAGQSWIRERALMDSARSVPPKLRMEWLHEHHQGWRNEDGGLRTTGDSGSGLKLVSKWGRGPAAEVTGKDTLVVLTLGSEVALLNYAQPDSPRVLSEIQFPSLTAQSYLEDSLLYTSSNADLEVWNIANPTQPVKRGQLLGAVGDFWIRDTFLYFIRNDTFHVISIANSANLRELGSCVESGSVTTGSGNTVVVCQSGGSAFVDVSNPANPHEVATYACGYTLSATARGNLVCASYEETSDPYPTHFVTLDISTPSSPRLLAELNHLGGFDIFLDGPLAFISGGDPGSVDWVPFQILSIADSAHPAFVDTCRTTNDFPWGVWENSTLNLVFVADRYDGLAVVDISNLNNAMLDTWVLKTGSAWDVHVDGNRCYVAGYVDGLRLLDVTDPMQPTFLSGLDTSFTDASDFSATARDSFAFIGWRNPYLRVASVNDPRHPQMVAACSVFSNPEDMVLRDSLLYCTEDYRFQIVNIARPRAPTSVGSCGMVDGTYWGFVLQDSFAYCGSWDGLSIVNVANPAAPFVVSQTSGTRLSTWGIAVRETLAFIPSGDETLWVYSVANPAAPYPIAGVPLGAGNWGYDAAMYDDTLVLAGCTYGVVLVNVSDPANPRVVGGCPAPSNVIRVFCSPPYLYAACNDAGVCIFETAAVGVTEATRMPQRRNILCARPNPARDWVDVAFASPLEQPYRLALVDAAGREVLSVLASGPSQERRTRISLKGLAPGLYFLRAGTEGRSVVLKIVKQ